MRVFLAPDVYVNASVAPDTAPDRVVALATEQGGKRVPCSPWVLRQVHAMLQALPEFKPDALRPQLEAIRNMVDLIEDQGTPDAASWESSLVAAAKASGADRVVTDHPDLLAAGEVGGIEFLSTDAWLVEASMPPPVPPPRKSSAAPPVG